jgi:hypothetical protein
LGITVGIRLIATTSYHDSLHFGQQSHDDPPIEIVSIGHNEIYLHCKLELEPVQNFPGDALAFGLESSISEIKARNDFVSICDLNESILSMKAMPKRFPIGPLSEHDDDWLTVWAWLNTRSKSAQVADLISYGIRERKAEIDDALAYIAKKRGITPEDLFQRILDGTVNQEVDETEGEE